MDSGLTPQILVNAKIEGVDVPREFIQDSAIVLNVHDRAVQGLEMTNESVSFSARFSGQARQVFVPIEAILAIYARENGQGLFFELLEQDGEEAGADVEHIDGKDSESATEGQPKRSKPHLKLV